MPEKEFRIGVFASSISLAERIQHIADQQQDHMVIAREGLDEAVPVGEKMEKSGIEVIVSRRGTAHLLRENLRIPVLSLPQTSLDILTSLKLAATVGHRILLPTFRNTLSGLDVLEELLQIELIQMVYSDSSSLEQVVAIGRDRGCEVVIGGSVTMRFAKEQGLEFVEIVTSKVDIIATIENAKSVVRSNREEKAMAQRYRSIIDATSDGILAVDEKGCITTINTAARKLFAIGQNDITGKSVADYLPNLAVAGVLETGKPLYDKIERVNGHLFVFNHLPVMMDNEIIGAVSTFKDISNVMRAENKVRRSLAKGFVARYFIEDLVHESSVMRDIVNIGKQFAKTDSTILVMGETGTGKEVLVQSIHNLSKRKKSPFVSVNCAALPEQLLESELFGYEEGAFTGSKKGGKPGLFEIAHKGTIFLDEIDTTPENVQIRLLRILQEREVMRVGGDRKVPIDVRVIAAASKDLALAVQKDRFREDLFFRLNVLLIRLPPLRERREDIPVLLDFFIQLISKKHQMQPIALPQGYIQNLMVYDWPGNVRQLQNFAERLILNCNLRCGKDMLDELYFELVRYPIKEPSGFTTNAITSLKGRLKRYKIENESQIILKALEEARFCKSKAARNLGISRTTLWRKIKEAGLE